MIEPLFAMLLGTLFGFLAGLLPGIGTSTMIVVFFSFLIKQNILFLLIFYASMISASQYAGSITALVFGIPGENSSLPIIELRDYLKKEDQLAEAITFTAIGSFVGAMLIFAFTLSILDVANEYTFYLKSWATAATGILGLVLAIIFSNNKAWISILLIISGWILSSIGINQITQKDFLTFGNDYLRGGLPNITILLGLFALPNFMKFFKMKIDLSNKIEMNYISKLSRWQDQIIVIIRSAVFGFILGLVPYVGTNLSSNIAFYIERWVRPKDYLSQAVAAESANNAATISVLIPMLIFGIAIQIGEGMILDIINISSRTLTWNYIITILPMLSMMLVLGNALSLLIAWPLVVYSINFLEKYSKYIPSLLAIICIYTAWAVGEQSHQGYYYLVCLFTFCLIGFFLKTIDTMPLIFSFLLQETLEPSIIRTIKIIYMNIG